MENLIRKIWLIKFDYNIYELSCLNLNKKKSYDTYIVDSLTGFKVNIDRQQQQNEQHPSQL